MLLMLIFPYVHRIRCEEGDEEPKEDAGEMTPVYVLGLFLLLFVVLFLFLIIFSKRNR